MKLAFFGLVTRGWFRLRALAGAVEFGSTEAQVSQAHKYSAGGDSIGKRIDQTSIDPFFPMLTNQPSVCCQPEPLFKCDHLAAPTSSISLARRSHVTRCTA